MVLCNILLWNLFWQGSSFNYLLSVKLHTHGTPSKKIYFLIFFFEELNWYQLKGFLGEMRIRIFRRFAAFEREFLCFACDRVNNSFCGQFSSRVMRISVSLNFFRWQTSEDSWWILILMKFLYACRFWKFWREEGPLISTTQNFFHFLITSY